MGRRRLVKSLSGLGVSATALATGQIEEIAAATADDTNTIVRTHSYQHTNHRAVVNGAKPTREAKFHTIPRDEWVRTETAYNAAQKIRNKVKDIPFVSVTPDVNSNKYSETVIRVSYTTIRSGPEQKGKEIKRQPPVSLDKVQQRLPDATSGTVEYDGRSHRISNIPIMLEKESLQQSAVYSSLYRPVPAGCQLERGDFSNGTIGCPAYDMGNSQPGWITAAHVLKRQKGVDIYQPATCCTTFLGESKKYTPYGEGDIGMFHSNGESRKYDIADKGENNYMGLEIYGNSKRQIKRYGIFK